MRKVSDKSCRENQNTHFVFNAFFFFYENRAVYEIMWKNMVERGRLQMTIWRARIACWITKATDTLKICNTYCFPTATTVTRTFHIATLHVQGIINLHHFCEQPFDISFTTKFQAVALNRSYRWRTQMFRKSEGSLSISDRRRIKDSSRCHDITQVTRPWIIS